MGFVPPTAVNPAAVGSPYMETFPSFAGTYGFPLGLTVRPVTPFTTTTRPAAVARGRVRRPRAARAGNGVVNATPPPYATQLPTGQLYWPGSGVSPNYSPYSRYQSYGSGYSRGPYGSNFYGGLWKGFWLGD